MGSTHVGFNGERERHRIKICIQFALTLESDPLRSFPNTSSVVPCTPLPSDFQVALEWDLAVGCGAIYRYWVPPGDFCTRTFAPTTIWS